MTFSPPVPNDVNRQMALMHLQQVQLGLQQASQYLTASGKAEESNRVIDMRNQVLDIQAAIRGGT